MKAQHAVPAKPIYNESLLFLLRGLPASSTAATRRYTDARLYALPTSSISFASKVSIFSTHVFISRLTPSSGNSGLIFHCNSITMPVLRLFSSFYISFASVDGLVGAQYVGLMRQSQSFASTYSGMQVGGRDAAEKVRGVLSRCRTGATEVEVFQFLLRSKSLLVVVMSHRDVMELMEGFSADWKLALGFLRWAASHPGCEISVEAYDKMIDTLGKMRQIEQMWKLVEEMREKGVVRLETFAKIMRRLAGCGRYEDAVKVFDDLGEYGFRKDVVSMNLLLDTLCKEGRVERGRELYLELKRHIAPNTRTFTILIHGWCKIGRIEEAQWTVLEMRGLGFRPCVVAYSIMLRGYCKQSNFSKAFELLDEMRANGIPPNVVTYTSMIHSLASEDRIDEAFEVLEMMKRDRCQLDTIFYNTFIHVLGKARMVDQAAHVFLVEMPKRGVLPNVSTYNNMVSMLCFHSREKDALGVLREMDNSINLKPDLLTYHPLLKMCFRLGKTDDFLRKMLDDMMNKHHLSFDLDTYMLLIHGLCHAGKIDWAHQLFIEMICQDITPKYKTCRLLLKEAEDKYMVTITESVKTFMEQMKGSLR